MEKFWKSTEKNTKGIEKTNGKRKLASKTKSLNKQRMEELTHHCGFFLTNRRKMWRANYRLSRSLKNLDEGNLT